VGTGGSFTREVRRPGREIDRSPRFSAEVMNAWSFSSPPPQRTV
jgi:hypothetical protein